MIDLDSLSFAYKSEVDPETSKKVALLACAYATDVDDARLLLQLLGIIPDPEAKPVHHVLKLGHESTRKHRKKS